MANSSFLGGETAPQHATGTGTDLLGPSDSSDSGSDIQGADGAVDTDEMGFDTGGNSDIRRAAGAGADIGDANLDSDTDRSGTGERAEAGRDTLRREAPDIQPDHVEGSDEAMVEGQVDRDVDIDQIPVEDYDEEDDPDAGKVRGDDVNEQDKAVDA